MARLTVKLAIAREDDYAFWLSFDEDRVVSNLPGSYAHLVWAGDPPTVEFYVEAESAARFRAEFDPTAIERSLPVGSRAALLDVTEDRPSLAARIRAAMALDRPR